MVYETWVGPTYLSGFAGEAGVSVGMVAFLSALPWMAQTGQLLGLFAVQGTPSIKRYVMSLAVFARGLWVVPLAWALWTQKLTSSWFMLLALSAMLAALLSSSSAVAWMTWMKAMIPHGFHGRFFGARQRVVTFAVMLANALAAWILSQRDSSSDLRGYAVLGVLAVVAAGVSSVLLARVPDVRVAWETQRLPRQMTDVLKRPESFSLILMGAVFTGVVQLAGPYFPYFFTHELNVSMGEVSFWTLAANLGAFVASGRWGKYLDQDPRRLERVVMICGVLIVLSPLPYIFLSAEVLRWFAPLEYFVNGAAWAGLNLAVISTAFRWIPAAQSAAFFSVYTAVLGATGAIFASLGARWLKWSSGDSAFESLWVLGSAVRGVTLILVLTLSNRVLKRVKRSWD